VAKSKTECKSTFYWGRTFPFKAGGVLTPVVSTQTQLPHPSLLTLLLKSNSETISFPLMDRRSVNRELIGILSLV
jgi:hypothetical protein